MNKNPSPARSILVVALLVACFGLATSLRAQLVTYNINTAEENATLTVTSSSAPNTTASTLFAEASLSPYTGTPFGQGHYLFQPWQGLSAPVAGVKYYEFGVTAAPGFQMTFTTVQYTIASIDTPTWQLRSSVDGFSSNFGANTVSIDSTQNDITDSIASLGTQTGTVTFRLYGYNSTGNGFNGLVNKFGTFGGDPGQNLIINGTVSPVPEPHQYAIIAGLGLLGFAVYRQRNRLSKLA